MTVPRSALASVVLTSCWGDTPADWALLLPGWTGCDARERLLSAPPVTSTGWGKKKKQYWHYHHIAPEMLQLQTWLCVWTELNRNTFWKYMLQTNRNSAPICIVTLPSVGRAQSLQEVLTKCCPDTSHWLLQHGTNERSSLGASDEGGTSLWCG